MTFVPLLAVLFLAQLDPRVVVEAAPATQPVTVNVTVAAATQPAAGTVGKAPATFQDAFGATTGGQLFEGKKTLSPEELIKVQFWLNAGKDLGMAAIGFVPRIFVALVFLAVFWLIYRGF